jgi:hypothetical protein
MGRRRNFTINRSEDGYRASIGDGPVDVACARLDKAVCIEARMITDRVFMTDTVASWLFPDDLIALLKQASPYVDPSSQTGSYEPLRGAHMPSVNMRFDQSDYPPPTALALRPYQDRIVPLEDMICAVNVLRQKYGAVKHLLRWFNRNATPAAVRTYWPSVLTLCKDSPIGKDYPDVPSRYTVPTDIGKVLPLIRDTAATVAMMQMLPADVFPRPRGQVWLTYGANPATHEGVDISLDSLMVNL